MVSGTSLCLIPLWDHPGAGCGREPLPAYEKLTIGWLFIRKQHLNLVKSTSSLSFSSPAFGGGGNVRDGNQSEVITSQYIMPLHRMKKSRINAEGSICLQFTVQKERGRQRH